MDQRLSQALLAKSRSATPIVKALISRGRLRIGSYGVWRFVRHYLFGNVGFLVVTNACYLLDKMQQLFKQTQMYTMCTTSLHNVYNKCATSVHHSIRQVSEQCPTSVRDMSENWTTNVQTVSNNSTTRFPKAFAKFQIGSQQLCNKCRTRVHIRNNKWTMTRTYETCGMKTYK